MRSVWSVAAALGSKSTPGSKPQHQARSVPRRGRADGALATGGAGFMRIRGSRMPSVPQFRIADAARLLGVSDDTVRRWIDAGTLSVQVDRSTRKGVDGAELAAFARRQASVPPDPAGVHSSARNRLVGLVTAVTSDRVMAQVEMQCGPHR